MLAWIIVAALGLACMVLALWVWVLRDENRELNQTNAHLLADKGRREGMAAEVHRARSRVMTCRKCGGRN